MTPSQIAVNDIGSAEDFLAAIEGTIKNFNDGDLVSGIVVLPAHNLHTTWPYKKLLMKRM